MLPEVRTALLTAAEDFWGSMELPEDAEPLDILLVGSTAGYNWSEFSDIDIHVVAEYGDINSDEDLVRDYGMKARSVWNSGHDVEIGVFAVEVYLQDANDPHITPGIYSLVDDMWVVEPTKERPVVDINAAITKAEALMHDIDSSLAVLRTNREAGFDLIDTFTDKLYGMRQAGLTDAGLYSVENVAFKILRRNGYLDKLKDSARAELDDEMSVKPQTESVREFSSTQVQLPEEIRDLFFRKAGGLPDEQLSMIEGVTDGREDDPHITVKYGLHTGDHAEVEAVLKEYGPIEVTMLGVGKFTQEDHDVLYVEVDSPGLHVLNEVLASTLECTDTHPTYTPHATLAYVKSGVADAMLGDEFAKGQLFVADTVVFSCKDGTKREVLLSGTK